MGIIKRVKAAIRRKEALARVKIYLTNQGDDGLQSELMVSEIARFIWAVLSHWQAYATGGVVTGIVNVVERLSGKTLPKKAYALIFVIFFLLVAFFLAWHEQYEIALQVPILQSQLRAKEQAEKPQIQINVPPAQVVIVPQSSVKLPVNPKSKRLSPQLPEAEPTNNSADVRLRFINPKSPVLIIVNSSDAVARNIKWAVALWNEDLPDRNDPLPIPVSTFDWIKPHQEGGPEDLFGTPNVSSLLKPNNRLSGSASVDCPVCIRGRTYVLYIIWGQGGWFSELENEKSGGVLVPKTVLKDSIEAFFRQLQAAVPENLRVPIGER
jgi:hypothetical protein